MIEFVENFKQIIKKEKLFFFLIILLGFCLRIYKWSSYSFWFDEALWMILAKNCIRVIKNSYILAKPPLFGLTLCLWKDLGTNELILRLLPIILGTLSIIEIYKAGEFLFDKKVGIISAFILSISPFHIYYSQELTHYTLVTFLVLKSINHLLLFLNEGNKNKNNSWFKFVIFTVLSIYTSYICLFLIFAENMFFFIFYKRYRYLINKWLIGQLLIFILFSPWLIMLFKQIEFLKISDANNWIPKGSWSHLMRTFDIFNVSYNANFLICLYARPLFFSLLFLGTVLGIKTNFERKIFLLLWLFIPMILSIATSSISPAYTYRNFNYSSLAYYIIIAYGLSKLRNLCLYPIFFIVLFSSMSLYNYYRNLYPLPEIFYRTGVHPKKDNRSATNYILANFQNGDMVYHTCYSTVVPFLYYASFSPIEKVQNMIKKDYSMDPLEYVKKFAIKNKSEIRQKVSGYRKVWLVFSAWEPQNLNFSENIVKDEFNTLYPLLKKHEFTGTDIYLYKIE